TPSSLGFKATTVYLGSGSRRSHPIKPDGRRIGSAAVFSICSECPLPPAKIAMGESHLVARTQAPAEQILRLRLRMTRRKMEQPLAADDARALLSTEVDTSAVRRD